MSRRRRVALALMAGVITAMGVYRWTATDELTRARQRPLVLPAQTAVFRNEPVRPTVRPPSLPSPAGARAASPVDRVREPSSEAKPTPSVFDFATPPRVGETESAPEERFVTNEWFTEEHLRHPEIYFEVAEQMPELNRPEERRDTLEFFLAYRDKLQRDLAVAVEQGERRREILATIERYDNAIARLRKLMDGGDGG
jgi:hypothetical protein